MVSPAASIEVSVIVPSYNARDHISRCLQSLRDQKTLHDFETIVVDSSEDATPEIVRDYIVAIPKCKTRTMSQMREDLAKTYRADVTCPTSTGIFVRINAEVALDELRAKRPITKVTPFWRVIDPASPAAQKVSCGADFIQRQRDAEA